jgi:hypothetical protein
MTGFQEGPTAYVANPHGLVGQRRRVGGIGQVYKIGSLHDDKNVLIHTEHTGQDVTYPIAEALLDPLADEPIRADMGRYSKLVGQCRSIGNAGPKYEVVSVEENGKAKIWIIPNDNYDDYDVEDILLDPMAD